MMTLRSNPTYLISALLLGVLLFPLPSFADEKADNAAFCREVGRLSEKLVTPIETRSKETSKNQMTKVRELASLRAERDQRKREERTLLSTTTQKQFDTLKARAETNEEKRAVQNFKKALDAALSVRSKAVDSALSAFRSGLDRSVTRWQKGIEGATDTFVKSVETAIDTAEKNCKAGGATARATFQKSFRDAQLTFKKNMDQLGDIKTSVDALTATRNTAFEVAQKNFMTAVEKAVEDLKKAFPDA